MTEKIKVGIGRTYNTGNYESIRLDVWIEEDFEFIANLGEVQARMFNDVLAQLNADAEYLGLKETKHP